MSEQSTIQFNPVSPVVHRDDPHTSTLSARQVTRSGTRKRQAEEVLRQLRMALQPEWYWKQLDTGITSAELAQSRGLDRHMTARRLPELADPKNGGLIERGPMRQCRVTGRQAITWRVREGGE
jgi:hypothetical protein